MKLLIKILPYVACLVLGMLLFNECNRKPKKETIIRSVMVPEVITKFDTIEVEKPVKFHIVDTVYVDRFIYADSTQKIDLYKDAVAIREYNQVFEDSLSKIEVYSKTRGDLLKQSVDLTIFNREVIDTVPLPRPKGNLYLVPEFGTNTKLDGLRAKAGLMYQDRKKHLYSLSIDTDGYIYVGTGIKF
ncbi:hypothetical protein I215_01943 [Galbibacter marinus]|uniref:Uncharacterized protein n=1 Tax=Galbibacter marinus TaxID=555500 RepID=K2PUB1_9FLAO|nr:hypothetical protein [Galbibacter marinus]EKF56245.1 hypothetical protein I215_01943 [Galbibacter marinus]